MQYQSNQFLLDKSIFYHVVFRAYGSLPLFKSSMVSGQIIEFFEETISERSLDVVIYRLLSDHVHFLLLKRKHQSVPDLVKFLKGRSTYYFYQNNPNYKVDLGRGRLWAKGYYAKEVVTFAQLENTILYIQDNHDRHIDKK